MTEPTKKNLVRWMKQQSHSPNYKVIHSYGLRLKLLKEQLTNRPVVELERLDLQTQYDIVQLAPLKYKKLGLISTSDGDINEILNFYRSNHKGNNTSMSSPISISNTNMTSTTSADAEQSESSDDDGRLKKKAMPTLRKISALSNGVTIGTRNSNDTSNNIQHASDNEECVTFTISVPKLHTSKPLLMSLDLSDLVGKENQNKPRIKSNVNALKTKRPRNQRKSKNQTKNETNSVETDDSSTISTARSSKNLPKPAERENNDTNVQDVCDNSARRSKKLPKPPETEVVIPTKRRRGRKLKGKSDILQKTLAEVVYSFTTDSMFEPIDEESVQTRITTTSSETATASDNSQEAATLSNHQHQNQSKPSTSHNDEVPNYAFDHEGQIIKEPNHHHSSSNLVRAYDFLFFHVLVHFLVLVTNNY